MNLLFRYCCLITFFIPTLFCFNQNPQIDSSGIRIMFYNVENLFHPSNDTVKRDDEFTPDGGRHWTYSKYKKKIAQIAQNTIAIGEWDPPAIIGLCEVENLQCLKDLVYNSPLNNFDYEIIHHESKDKRGIDVAFLYRPTYFKLINDEAFVLKFPDSSHSSRDILYAKGLVGNDTLHCFVNHWPSRYGGELATKPKRNLAAFVLKSKFDSIQKTNPNAKIIAMGDFNDYPSDESMQTILAAKKDTSNLSEKELVNLIWQYEKSYGTHKYQGEWHILDQFIVNQALLNDQTTLSTRLDLAHIYKNKWLLEDEKNGFGQKPFRTYNGFRYAGGYSDHLPIYVDILSIR